MERKEDNSNLLLEEIKKELEIIEKGDNEKSPSDCISTKKVIKSEIRASRRTSDSIESNIRAMQSNLDEIYTLLQTIGKRFEDINFNSLKNQIRDLHLNDRNNGLIKVVVEDLRSSFNLKYMEHRIEDLTKKVTTKFREHPGEFGDIPELSKFFTSCTQLQHGLESLQKYKEICSDLEIKTLQAAESSYHRIDDIRCEMSMNKNRRDEQVYEN